MEIGVVKEIKNNENRVGMTPSNVKDYVNAGHKVYIETNAGEGSGFSNKDYEEAGAVIANTAKECWDKEMVVKVKEPLAEEYDFFHEGLILYTYLHLAAEPELTKAILDKKVTAIAYETVQIGRSTPLLRPMSEVAGRRSVTIGAQFLEKFHGGAGVLLGGTPGADRTKVTVVGGGIAGTNAAQMAVGLGADVTILELNEDRIRELHVEFGGKLTVLKSSYDNIMKSAKESHLLVSTVLIPGEKAPKLVTEEMVKAMPKGSVIVDISIDQGGSVETIDRITTHDDPTYVKHDVIHYSVANMPGAVPRTSTIALTNATTTYGVLIATHGYKKAMELRPELVPGLNCDNGEITNDHITH
ncbi:MAG: alanine dehydrogenase [Mycoplasmatales bacterium]